MGFTEVLTIVGFHKAHKSIQKQFDHFDKF